MLSIRIRLYLDIYTINERLRKFVTFENSQCITKRVIQTMVMCMCVILLRKTSVNFKLETFI